MSRIDYDAWKMAIDRALIFIRANPGSDANNILKGASVPKGMRHGFMQEMEDAGLAEYRKFVFTNNHAFGWFLKEEEKELMHYAIPMWGDFKPSTHNLSQVTCGYCLHLIREMPW